MNKLQAPNEPWPPVRNADDCERLLETFVMAGLDGGLPLLVSDGISTSCAHLMTRADICRYWFNRFGVEIPPSCLKVH